jgi:hypothetical protein
VTALSGCSCCQHDFVRGMIEDQESFASNNENEERDTPTEIARDQTETRRSSRATRPPKRRMNMYKQETEIMHLDYTDGKARLAVLVISEMNAMHTGCKMQLHSSFAQTYSLRAGLKKFGTRGNDAATKEFSQLHHRAAFVPITLDSLSNGKKEGYEKPKFSVRKARWYNQVKVGNRRIYPTSVDGS